MTSTTAHFYKREGKIAAFTLPYRTAEKNGGQWRCFCLPASLVQRVPGRN